MNYSRQLLAAGGFALLASQAIGSDNVVRDTASYLAPGAEYLKSVFESSPWSRAKDAFMKDPLDEDPRIGRGQAEFVLKFAVTGVELKKQGDDKLGEQCLKAALDTLRGFNKIGDDPKKFAVEDDMNLGSIGQIGFVLPEVATAARVLYQIGYLNGEDLKRTNRMLEVIADHWLKHNPQVGMSGMSNWNNRHGLGALTVASFLELQKVTSEETLKKIKDYRRYASAVLLRGADYPYGYKLTPDGKIAPAVKIERGNKETPAPADRIPHFGVTENASAYNADSIYSFLHLIAEMPKSEIPQIDEKRMKELCEWLKGWQSQVMSNGVVPSYSDSYWAPGVTWGAVFEKAAAMFAEREKYGDAAAGFKATALAINDYHQKHCGGVENGELAKVLLDSTYRGEIKRAPETSKIIEQPNPHGEMQPAKVVLRGDDDNRAFAMFQTFHNASHSHGDIGCLAAYSVNGKVMQHETGYDAGEIYFHQQMLIRPAGEEFIPFAQTFKDPQTTQIQKGDKNLPPGGIHQYKSVSLKDHPDFAFTRVETNYRTSLPNLRRAEFTATRQAVLDKKSGALIVFDSVKNDRNIKETLAFSPLWHVQNVLSKREDGFVCADEIQGDFLRQKRTVGTPTGPFWIGMKGPEGFTPEKLTWQFVSKANRFRFPQKEHLYLKGNQTIPLNESVGVVSVLMPLEKAEITEAPAKISVDGNSATVEIDHRRYTIDENGATCETLVK